MSSKVNSKPNTKPSDVPAPASGSQYAPSVPISVYKEVANELNSTKTKLESFRLQNQELVQQNQQLRIEIERVVQSALQLRRAADAHSSSSPSAPLENLPPAVEVHFEPPIAPSVQLPPQVSDRNEPTPPPVRQLFTEQPQQQRRPQPEKNTELGGGWLILAILLIVITAFGTGFLIVRPLLPHR